MQIPFVVPEGDSYIDLALALSIVNRRGYNQESMKYAVAKFEFLNSGLGNITVGKLPETWVYEQAYRKSLVLYNEMNDQVLDTEPDIQGRYAEFKIAMNPDMLAQTIQTAANPIGRILTPNLGAGAWTSASYDETGLIRANWDYSTLEIPNDPTSGVTTEYGLFALGASTPTAKGLVEGYALSRSRPQTQDPNTPITPGWMNDLFDVGEQLEEIREDLEADNDRPPYAVVPHGSPGNMYVGGGEEFANATGIPQVHGFCNFTTTTVSQKNSIAGGVFNNGLIYFSNDSSATALLLLHLVPGTHRGYLAEEF